MIWFGNVHQVIDRPAMGGYAYDSDSARMQIALERVAEKAPGLWGARLVDALAETGWVDRSTAERLLPQFRHFDPDRHFSEYLRRLSFRGRSAADEFRDGIRCIFEEIIGEGTIGLLGTEPCIRFTSGQYEGVVLAQPEVSFSIAGRTREALSAAIEEMPDVVTLIARNFDPASADQVRAILDRSEIPGTLITLNQLLGIRATALRYQPGVERVIALLATGGSLRSADIARLGNRAA